MCLLASSHINAVACLSLLLMGHLLSYILDNIASATSMQGYSTWRSLAQSKPSNPKMINWSLLHRHKKTRTLRVQLFLLRPSHRGLLFRFNHFFHASTVTAFPVQGGLGDSDTHWVRFQSIMAFYFYSSFVIHSLPFTFMLPC